MTTLDLTARYRTEGSGLTGGLDVTLGIQNLFNDKPDPITGIFLDAPYDSTNYSPIGRYVSLRSEEHTSELQSLMRISYAVFYLTKKKKSHTLHNTHD